MSSLFSLNTSALEQQLCLDRENLISRIRDQLHRSDDPALVSLANHMAEVDGQEVADLLNDTGLAVLRHELSALREIDLALQRVRDCSYGICADCGRTIEPARLKVQPNAHRCLRCKTAFEKRRGIVRNPAI